MAYTSSLLMKCWNQHNQQACNSTHKAVLETVDEVHVILARAGLAGGYYVWYLLEILAQLSV